MQKIFSQRQISAVERLVYWQGKRMRTVNCLTEDYHDDKMLPLSLSVDLICCIETFFAMVLLIQSPDLLTMNGRYFYFLDLFSGNGDIFFALHVIMCVSCAFTAVLLYFGTRMSSPRLFLPHIIWQCVFIITSLTISIALLILGYRGDILFPSSIVLSALLIVPAICEIWCCYLIFRHYRHMTSKNIYKIKYDSFVPSTSFIISTEC